MAVHLVVLSPFAAYAVGDVITDAAEVERWAGSPYVVRMTPPAAPPPTEEELQERAEALAELERLKAKLGSAVSSEAPQLRSSAPSEAVAIEAQAASGAVSAKQEG